jgi:hypothetical protein
MQNKFKRPKDTNQKAKMIVDIATGEAEEVDAGGELIFLAFFECKSTNDNQYREQVTKSG